jgi:hypothetical protein
VVRQWFQGVEEKKKKEGGGGLFQASYKHISID